jgi:hypothetical protein
MTAFPAAGYIGFDTRTEAEAETAFEDWLAATKQLPGGAAETTLTIATGAVTPNGATHAIDTEAAAASDDLDTINQTNLPDGSILWLHAADNARVPTVRHNQGGIGKILLADATNLALANTGIWLRLQRKGTTWEERLRFYGASSALARAFGGIGKESLAKSGAYTVVAADRSKLINCSATLTLTLTAAATLGDGFEFEVVNSSASGAVTIDPNGAETIDGVTTVVLAAGEACLVRGNGTAWQTVARPARIGLIQGKVALTIPASAWRPTPSTGCAALADETLATNGVPNAYLAFDSAVEERAYCQLRMPKSWNGGTISFAYTWMHPATTTNFGVAFGLKGLSRTDNEALDAAFGTEVVQTDTGGTTNNNYTSAESAAVTLSGTPAGGETVTLVLSRKVADAGDTLAVDAKLREVTLFITLNAANDA